MSQNLVNGKGGGITDAAAFRTALGLRDILSVADAAARKDAGTYIGDNSVSVGYTRVVQADLPDVLWTLVAADVTQDASWSGVKTTTDPAGFPDLYLQP